MNIHEVKEQIKNTIKVYLLKDAIGNYRIPFMHQRPIFIQGPPGLGKTAIIQQIAEEMNIGLVSYSMTHHTRQSAIGLPVIVQKEYEGTEYSVSEYTMSEIIASVYECMRQTGCKEGILFLDEINCISETLAPSMLLFLQYKIFGGHSLPPGWIVVTAGNQARYNRSVKEFDAATRDRMKYMVAEPDYEAWKRYVIDNRIAQVIVSFLDIRTDCFYKAETKADGMVIVTPRSWEDLSVNLVIQEELQIKVEENFIKEYIQNNEIARDFYLYYQLYQKYRNTYDIDSVLNKTYSAEFVETIKTLRLDERMTFISLILEALFLSMRRCMVEREGLKIVKEDLLMIKKAAEEGVEKNRFEDLILQQEKDHRKKIEYCTKKKKDGYLYAIQTITAFRDNSDNSFLDFELCKTMYQKRLLELQQEVTDTQLKIENVLSFIREAFGEGNEMALVIHDLTITADAAEFIGQFLNINYFEEISKYQIHKKENDLQAQIKMELGD